MRETEEPTPEEPTPEDGDGGEEGTESGAA
jgi:hypothetical protein